MMDKLICGTVMLWVLGCGAKPAANSGEGAGGSDPEGGSDVKAALAREASGLTPQTVKSQISFTVPASGPPTVKTEDKVVLIDIPIAEGGTVNCFLYTDDPDPGATLLALLGGLKKSAQIRELGPGPIEVVHESPVVHLSALYTVDQEDGAALGQLKLAFHTRYNHASLCLNDQAGFSKTFLGVSRAFFESLQAGREDLKPRYAEVSAATIGGVPAGFERSMIFGDGKEERRVNASLLILLRTPTELVTSDSVSSQVLNAEGRLTGGEWYNSESGAPDLKVSLELGKAGAYHYTGTYKGKPIEGDFTHTDKRGLAGPASLETDLKKRAKKPGAYSFSHVAYNPAQDPTRPTEETYERHADDPKNRVRVKQGDLEVIGTIDESGRFEDGQATLGRMEIRLKRTFVRGKP